MRNQVKHRQALTGTDSCGLLLLAATYGHPAATLLPTRHPRASSFGSSIKQFVELRRRLVPISGRRSQRFSGLPSPAVAR